MIGRHAVTAAAMCAALLLPPSCGCKPKPAPRPVYHPWTITTTSTRNNHGAYLGNGFIAARIGDEGWGSMNGKPMGCFMAGLYSGETLAEVPHWSSVEIRGRRGRFRLDKDLPYRQTLDMRGGFTRTSCSMRSGRDVIDLDTAFFVSRVRPTVAVMRFSLKPRRDMEIRIVSPTPSLSPLLRALQVNRALGNKAAADFLTAARTMEGTSRIAVAARTAPPAGLRVRSVRAASGGRGFETTLRRDRTYRFVRTIAVTRTNRFGDPARSALVTLASAQAIGAENLFAEHKAAWHKVWQADIKIEGDPEAQQIVHSCMFYLLQSVREGADWSIPPTGISSSAWNGHVFWDADTWMLPALLPQHPEMARSIVDYRFKTLSGARANARKRGLSGVEYAWESAATGREAIGKPFSEERHITADVAVAQWQYYLATGNRAWLRRYGYPILRETANYWTSRVTYNRRKGRYEILRVVPPDENAEVVNNSVYTNAAAKRNLEIAVEARRALGRRAPFFWRYVADRMYLPFDKKNGRYVEFDGYAGQPTKQADTELLIYPLDLPMPRHTAVRTFDYYRRKVLPKSPAMASSVHAVIAARLGRREEAYRHFRKSYRPYLRGPFNMFNEKPSRVIDNTCFLTGAAGTLQSVIYGFGGLRITDDRLEARPLLPAGWQRLAIRNIKWHGKRYDLVVEPGGYRLRTVNQAINSKKAPKTSRRVSPEASLIQ